MNLIIILVLYRCVRFQGNSRFAAHSKRILRALREKEELKQREKSEREKNKKDREKEARLLWRSGHWSFALHDEHVPPKAENVSYEH